MGVKLGKVAQKVFGASSGANQLSKFGSLFAGSPDTTISADDAGAAAAQGTSNWLTGWFGAAIGGASPAIEDQNSVDFVVTRQLAYIQQMGVAEWDAVTEYFIGSIVNNAGTLYRSLTDNNINNAVSDTTNWKGFSTDPVGVMKDFLGSTVPAGFVLASGRTIGNATSGGTERANADTVALFTLLWTDYANTVLAIQDSAGAASTRGANAAADFAANKRMPLPDLRGRVAAGKDDMGGSAASRLTSTVMSPNGTTLGATGGVQTYSMSMSEMPIHTHTIQDPGHQHQQTYGVNGGGTTGNNGFGTRSADDLTANYTVASVTGVSALTNGSGAAHQNTQPTFIVNKIIKL